MRTFIFAFIKNVKLSKSLVIFIASFIALFGFVSNALAAPNWFVVPQSAKLSFTGIQNNVPVTAYFKKFTAEIKFDPNQLEQSFVKINIDMTSVASNYEEIRNTLLSENWFDVKHFPTATFVSNQFQKKPNHTFEIQGTLTLKDQPQPITVFVVVDDLTSNLLSLHGFTIINRSLFNVGKGVWSTTDIVKDEVKIEFSLKATPAKTEKVR